MCFFKPGDRALSLEGLPTSMLRTNRLLAWCRYEGGYLEWVYKEARRFVTAILTGFALTLHVNPNDWALERGFRSSTHGILWFD